MFCEAVKPTRPIFRPRPIPKVVDVPGIRAFETGHIARDPNTSYFNSMTDYRRKKDNELNSYIEATIAQLNFDKMVEKYDRHFEKKNLFKSLKGRVQKKLDEYENEIEERRKKLTALLSKEEQEFYKEVVDEAQKSKERGFQEKVRKIREIEEKHETERQEFIKEMKIKQYINRCTEFRPVLSNLRLRESKRIQLLQIEEKKSQKEKEKELDTFWHNIMLKRVESLNEREKFTASLVEKQKNELQYFSKLQEEERAMKKDLKMQETERERINLEKLRQDIEREERELKEKKQRNKEELSNLLTDFIKIQEETAERINGEELSIQRAYENLANEEIRKEEERERAKVSTAHNDMIRYNQYLAEMKKQKEEEERKLDVIVKNTMESIQKKNDDERCKSEMARKHLHQTVLKEREIQIKYRQKQNEELKKIKDLEKKLTDMSRIKDQQLREEGRHINIMKKRNYYNNLGSQLQYNKILKDREDANMQKVLNAAKLEDEEYDRIVNEILKGDIKVSATHPFQNVINKEMCPCPKPNY